MADVKWIKITTDIFDDEKILLIESLPDSYAIITCWFKLLCLAGKMNNSGVFIMNNRVAYTDKMLATIFRMKESTVTMALETFSQFGMIEIIDGVITIPNWNKHQSLDAYQKRKERDRIYQAEKRAAQRALIEKSADASSDTSSDIGIVDIEEDKEIDKDKDKKSVRETTHTIFKRLLPDYNLSSSIVEKMSEWITYKVERKEPYKEQGMKSLLRQVENQCGQHGDQAVCGLIEECMANGWKGIIFDRLKQKPVKAKQQYQPSVQRSQPLPDETERLRRFLASMESGETKTAGNDEGVRQRAEELKRKLS